MRSKYDKTDRKIKRALIEVYPKRNIQHITIDVICRKADIHRNTFYTHFENIDCLIDNIIADYYKGINKYNYADSIDIQEKDLKNRKIIAMTNLMQYHSENKNIYLTLFSPSSKYWLRYKEAVKRDLICAQDKCGYKFGTLQNYVTDMNVAAIIETTYKWLTVGKAKAEDIASMLVNTLQI